MQNAVVRNYLAVVVAAGSIDRRPGPPHDDQTAFLSLYLEHSLGQPNFTARGPVSWGVQISPMNDYTTSYFC